MAVLVAGALSLLVMQSDGSATMLEPVSEIVEAAPSLPQLTPVRYLYEYYPAIAARLDRVIWCESEWQASAFNPRSRAAGLAQFLPSTWASTPQGRRGESVYNPYSNIDAAAWLVARSGWSQWVCR